MANRIAVAKFIEAGMGMGRSPIDCLQMLNAGELELVVMDFLKVNCEKFVVRMNPPVHRTNLIQIIKRVREITNCGLKESKDFVEGYGNLTVTAIQRDQLLREYPEDVILQ